MLTQKQKEYRVKWAEELLDQDRDDVWFTDESIFQFYSNTMKIWSKGKPTKKIPKHSPKVMLWGGISLRGKTNLSVVVGTMDSIVYQDIIDENLPTMFELYPEGFTLQQDNARPHTSRSTTEFMKKKKILVLKWPAGSPDLNPIENVWGIMKRKIERAGKKTVAEWKEEIQKIWEEINHDILRSLVESMPRRLRMVIEAKGETNKY
jgi:transposase